MSVGTHTPGALFFLFFPPSWFSFRLVLCSPRPSRPPRTSVSVIKIRADHRSRAPTFSVITVVLPFIISQPRTFSRNPVERIYEFFFYFFYNNAKTTRPFFNRLLLLVFFFRRSNISRFAYPNATELLYTIPVHENWAKVETFPWDLTSDSVMCFLQSYVLRRTHEGVFLGEGDGSMRFVVTDI